MDDAPHPPEEALAVETYVEQVRGQWQVAVVVVFATHVVRHVVSTYPTKRAAEIAASWIKRAADRDPGWIKDMTGQGDCNDE